MFRITAFLFFIFFYNTPVFAQGWNWGSGSIGNNITAWPVATDTFGNIFVAGVSKGAVSLDNNPSTFVTADSQYVIAKYDTWGDFLWARDMHAGANAAIINIATDLTGHCYLLGWMPDSSMTIGPFTIYNTIYPREQYFIAKYDQEGDVIWAKTDGGRSGIGTISPIALSNTHSVRMLGLGAISTDRSGNFYVTTSFNSPSVTVGNHTLINSDTSGATDDIILAKYDSLGNVIWAKSAGGSGEDIPFSLAVTLMGNIYIAGIFNSDTVVFGPSVITDTSTGPQKWDAFIARYNALGNPVWASGSGGTGNTYASGVSSDVWGNVYLAGGTADSTIFFNDTKIVDTNYGQPVLYLVKFDTSNKVRWNKTIHSVTGGAVWGYATATSPASSHSVWVNGAFDNQISIDGHLLDTPAASIDPIFIAGFDTSGYYISSGALQSGSSGQVGLACDTSGNIYVCADYKYPCAPFIIASDVLANVTINESWLYLAQYTWGGDGNGAGPIIKIDTDDISKCSFDTLSLMAPKGYPIYNWNDGSSDTLLTITTPGNYWVTCIGKANVTEIDTFRVRTDSGLCDCNAFLPSAFSPNGDGKNDTYAPVFETSCYITHYDFSIYNRWGQRVFHSQNPLAKWDGKFGGKDADLDVYMYYLKYTTNPSYPEHKKTGDVTLVR